MNLRDELGFQQDPPPTKVVLGIVFSPKAHFPPLVWMPCGWATTVLRPDFGPTGTPIWHCAVG